MALEVENLVPQEPIEVKLSDVCRSCLCRADGMTNFLVKTEYTSSLIAMLSSVGNFEVEVTDELPSYLCKSCKEKLRLSYDFQQLLQKSNEIIRQCLAETEAAPEADAFKVEFIVTQETPSKPKVKNKQTMRLSQFSPEAIEKAIEKSKEGFLNNVTCIKCNFVSSNMRALSVHMTHLHKELKERWCSICNSETEDLTEHSRQCHTNNELRCEFCDKVFTAKGHFTEHLRSHSNVRPFRCHVCEKGFISSRHLNNHLRIHTNERPYQCSYCPKRFIQKNSLRNHLKTHKESEVLKREDYADLGEENSEARLLSMPQNFCKKCDKKVRSLTVHLKKCHGNVTDADSRQKDRVLCTMCGKQFRTASKLRMHMRVHTGEVPYKCSYCDKRMSSRNQLVVHERIHTGEKPHVCNFCGKAFAQSSVLNTHMKIHTGRPELCEICMKRFCRPAQLRLHMRKHTGEKPFLCTECDQSFKQRSHLMEHQKTHSDERPYKCSYCEKGFKQNSSLKSHVQIHLGYKPFKCSQCPYACRQSYSLTQHMKQHTLDSPRPEKPHLCTICQKGFSTIAMLTSHSSIAHGIP